MKLHDTGGTPHLHRARVYYADTDAGGVVYHANYLAFAEAARTEALRDLGVAHAEMVSQHGVMFMVRRIKVDYLGSARLDDSLVIATLPIELGAASATIRQTVHRDSAEGPRLAELDVGLACVRLADQRPARMPPRWRDALAGLMNPRSR